MRELFRYKTLNTKEAHSSLFEKPYKNVLRVSFIYTKRSRSETLILFGLELLFGLDSNSTDMILDRSSLFLDRLNLADFEVFFL